MTDIRSNDLTLHGRLAELPSRAAKPQDRAEYIVECMHSLRVPPEFDRMKVEYIGIGCEHADHLSGKLEDLDFRASVRRLCVRGAGKWTFHPDADGWACSLRTITAKQARTRHCIGNDGTIRKPVRCFTRHMVECSYADIFGQNFVVHTRMVMGHGGDGVWRRCDTGQRIDALTLLEEEMVGRALADRYEWTVTMRVDEGPRIAFPATPEGARQAFKLRDLAPGKNRRDALRHWVSKHWRSTNTSTHEVRKHLRGKVEFVWSGIECEIIPSAFDRETEIARRADLP